jgi:single-strand DNA-binding protein
MATLNLCQFIGNVGKIETRYAQSGDAITNISLACNESWRDKNSGEKKEHVEWVRVSMFGKLAEIAQQYVKKGDAIYISGKMQTRKFTNKDGVDQYTTEIRADQMQMLGSKDGGDGLQEHRQSSSERPTQRYQSNQTQTAQQSYSGGMGDEFKDDLPF